MCFNFYVPGDPPERGTHALHRTRHWFSDSDLDSVAHAYIRKFIRVHVPRVCGRRLGQRYRKAFPRFDVFLPMHGTPTSLCYLIRLFFLYNVALYQAENWGDIRKTYKNRANPRKNQERRIRSIFEVIVSDVAWNRVSWNLLSPFYYFPVVLCTLQCSRWKLLSSRHAIGEIEGNLVSCRELMFYQNLFAGYPDKCN